MSKNAIKRAAKEASKRNLNVSFGIADFKKLEVQVNGTFDVVMSCANSLPHLLTDEELQLAAKNIYLKTKQKGLFIGSIKDYDSQLKNKPVSTPLIVKDNGTERFISFRIIKWTTNNRYLNSQFFIKTKGDESTTAQFTTEFRAYRKKEMNTAFESAGFHSVKWLSPEETGYTQPIMIAF